MESLSEPTSNFQGRALSFREVTSSMYYMFIVGEDSFNLFRPLFSDKKGGTILEKVR